MKKLYVWWNKCNCVFAIAPSIVEAEKLLRESEPHIPERYFNNDPEIFETEDPIGFFISQVL